MGEQRQAEVPIDQDMGIAQGDVVAGKYRIVRILGHGAMGVVAEAIHVPLSQRVAIKFLKPEVAGSKDATARFLREAKAIARIKSVHVARVTDISTRDDFTPFFVMEYLEGQDLEARLAKTGTLPITVAVDYAIQVCEALAEAHGAGIIHRDIKPANIFLTEASDGTTLVKLLDFGISRHTSEIEGLASIDLTGTRALLGTPRYMAPEQMRATKRIDHRADIWSLGVVLHQSLAGQTPFVGETLPEVCAAIAADDAVRVRQLRREVPIELQDVILRCLEKTPERRYSDVGQVANDLAPFASPDAAVAARRIGRIVRVLSTAPPPMPPESSPGSVDAPASVGGQAFVAPPVLPGVPPAPRPRHDGRLDLRWWLVILAAVAIPASVVGAYVRAPSPPNGAISPPAAKPDAGTLPEPGPSAR